MGLVEICSVAKESQWLLFWCTGMGIDDITGLAEVHRLPFASAFAAPVCCHGTQRSLEFTQQEPVLLHQKCFSRLQEKRTHQFLDNEIQGQRAAFPAAGRSGAAG